MDETQVVVVGGGPVGAALAGDLGRHGIRTIVLEMTDGVFRDPRMHAVNIRTMELMRRWGLEQQLRDCGWPKDHSQDVLFVTALDGYEIGRIPWPSIAESVPPPQSPTFAQRCPQSWFNPIMLDFARAQPTVDLRLLHRCDGFTQDQDCVIVHVTDLSSGKTSKIRAAWLVGCDGSRSMVRDALSVERSASPTYGHAAEVIFRSTDLNRLHDKGRAGRYTMITPTGMSASLLPYDGRDLYRLTLMAEAAKVSEADMRRSIRNLLISAEFAFELTTPVLGWVNRETNAEHYRVGRALLAGDAAHGMPPTGGFGMNTGLVDAADLAWKLAFVLRGWGGETLLDAYNSERRGAVARTARMAGAIYQDWLAMAPMLRQTGGLLSADSSEGAACRAQLGKHLVATFRREFNPLGGALGYSYEESPICVMDGTPAPEDTLVEYNQTSRPGHRAPHLWLRDGVSTIDLFGSGFVLLATAGNVSKAKSFLTAAQFSNVPLRLEVLPDTPAVAAAYPGAVTLVRPDGHVAWRGEPEETKASDLFARVTGRFETAERLSGQSENVMLKSSQC